jgi:hypothetical protein
MAIFDGEFFRTTLSINPVKKSLPAPLLVSSILRHQGHIGLEVCA